MSVEALNCPDCGAGVAGDSTRCQFCGTRLKTVVCPACLSPMFSGTRYCGHCGAAAVETEIKTSPDAGDCPRCRRPLELEQIGSITLRACAKCDGLWADRADFEDICADREKQSAVLVFVHERQPVLEPLAKVSYVPCPNCKQLMNRNNFAHSSGIIIDTCKAHGVWFDAGELPGIIEFVRNGGMEIARQREKLEIQDERQHLRADQREQALRDARLGNRGFGDPEKHNIVEFVRSLFD